MKTDLDLALERRFKLASIFNDCKGSKLKFRRKVMAYGFKEFGMSVMLVFALLKLALALYEFWASMSNIASIPTNGVFADEPNVIELGRLGR